MKHRQCIVLFVPIHVVRMVQYIVLPMPIVIINRPDTRNQIVGVSCSRPSRHANIKAISRHTLTAVDEASPQAPVPTVY